VQLMTDLSNLFALFSLVCLGTLFEQSVNLIYDQHTKLPFPKHFCIFFWAIQK
jgi:hypothetical protein